MAESSVNNHAGFIWSVADLLRVDYKQSEYGKVILPLTVLGRQAGHGRIANAVARRPTYIMGDLSSAGKDERYGHLREGSSGHWSVLRSGTSVRDRSCPVGRNRRRPRETVGTTRAVIPRVAALVFQFSDGRM